MVNKKQLGKVAIVGAGSHVGLAISLVLAETGFYVMGIETNRELLAKLSKGKPLSFKSVSLFKDDVKVRIPDITRAKKELGWSPSIKARESVRRCFSQP